MSDNLSARSIDRAPSHHKVHNLCYAPATVPPPVLDDLGLGLGYNLSLQRKDETPSTLTDSAKISALDTHFKTNHHTGEITQALR
jgi:hypothetical protein